MGVSPWAVIRSFACLLPEPGIRIFLFLGAQRATRLADGETAAGGVLSHDLLMEE